MADLTDQRLACNTRSNILGDVAPLTRVSLDDPVHQVVDVALNLGIGVTDDVGLELVAVPHDATDCQSSASKQ
jgi:hypothetical protein